MPKDGSAGFSLFTPTKQEDFEVIVGTHLKICKGILSREEWAHPAYHYFDLNAGPGIVNGEPGSPFRFLQKAQALSMPFKAWLFEKDDAAIAQLHSNLMQQTGPRYWVDLRYANPRERIEIVPGCHQTTFPPLLYRIEMQSRKIYGLAYADPNGTIPPFELFAAMSLCKQWRYVDVLIYLSATNIKRLRRAEHCPHESYLQDALLKIGKKHIIIREPTGQHQWTFALLTNWDAFPKFERQGFHRLCEPEGQRIMRRLNFTASEIEGMEAGE